MDKNINEDIVRINNLIKKFNLSESEDSNKIKLSDTTYTHVKYDNDETKNDYVNKFLLDDLEIAGKSLNIEITITTAKSGHDNKVSGKEIESRHLKGNAVDVSILNGIGSGGAVSEKTGNNKFRELGNELKDYLVNKLGYVWNKEIGNPKSVLWQTNIGGNHYNHLHISNKGDGDGDNETTGNNEEDLLLKKIMDTEYLGTPIKEWIKIKDTPLETLRLIFKMFEW